MPLVPDGGEQNPLPGIPSRAPATRTARPILREKVSNTPRPDQGVATDKAGKLPVSTPAQSLVVTTRNPDSPKIGQLWYRSDINKICIQDDDGTAYCFSVNEAFLKGSQGPPGMDGDPGPRGARGPEGGFGGYSIVQDEGIKLGQRDTLDFAGAGVTATDDSANGRTLITIPGASAGSAGTPVIQFVSATSIATFTAVPDGTLKNLGVPTGYLVGDVAIAVVSCKNDVSAIAGTISAGGTGWSGLAGTSHDSSYVWKTLSHPITGLNEGANWDQMVYSGGGSHTMVGMILVFRNVIPTVANRAQITQTRTADLNPLVTGDLTTYARPGDLLLHFVSSKNGAGTVSPPSGYTEMIDQVNGALWTYLSYKIAVGSADGSEKNASLTITPGVVGDHNDTWLTAIQHA